MSKYPNPDDWKDDFLARPSISIPEFNGLVAEQQIWLLANSHIFYNNKGEIKNLLHSRNKDLLAVLKKSNNYVRATKD